VVVTRQTDEDMGGPRRYTHASPFYSQFYHIITCATGETAGGGLPSRYATRGLNSSAVASWWGGREKACAPREEEEAWLPARYTCWASCAFSTLHSNITSTTVIVHSASAFFTLYLAMYYLLLRTFRRRYSLMPLLISWDGTTSRSMSVLGPRHLHHD